METDAFRKDGCTGASLVKISVMNPKNMAISEMHALAHLESLGQEARLALEVVRRLQAHGFSALLVGGCVRDILMGRVPEDYDVATDAHPEQMAQLFEKTLLVGAKFGVVVVVEEGAQVEVATFRTESGYSDRRHPSEVVFSDALHDARRRDFTINGLYFNPGSSEVIDYVEGRADIERRLIRAIGDPSARFSEDALRMLRALRFASSLDFEIDPGTWDAIKSLGHLVREISMERIRDELFRGLTKSHPDRFLQLLADSRLLAQVLPEIELLKGCEQPPEFHPEGDVFAHTKLMFSLLRPNPSPALAFAVLLHDVGKPATAEVSDRIRFNNHQKVGAQIAEEITRRLVFPNDLRERVASMVLRHMDFINLSKMRESTLRRFLADPNIDEELELHRVDCLASHGNLDNYELANERLAQIRAEEPEGALPPPLVTGNDLIAMGLPPGPAFKRLLRSVQDAQLEGSVHDRPEALQYLKSLVERGEEQPPAQERL